MTALNPHWPLVTVNADFTTGPPNLPGAAAMSLNAPSRRNAVRQINLQRGRQYELDQCQAGTATLTITDPLEQLHPANTGSPFNQAGNAIDSYRAMQVAAWWNPATQSVAGNWLNTANTPAGSVFGWDPSFEQGIASPAVPVGVTATTVSTPPDGALPVTRIVTPNTTAMMTYGLRLVPGTTYQMVADVFANTGVTVAMGTLLAGVATVGATTTITGAYQAISATFTAVAGQSLYFAVTAATGGFPATFFVAGLRCVGLSPGWTVGGAATMRVTTTLVGGAHSGIYALNNGYSSSSDTATLLVPTVPGVGYVMSSWLNAQITGSVGRMTIGAASVSTTTVNAWQRVALAFTAADALTPVTFTAPAGTYPVSIYVDDIQLEVGASATTFATSGPTAYPLYTGYIERYPLQWDMAGTRGIRPLTCTDALSVLSRTEIVQDYATTILADQPSVYIPYSDASFPQTIQLPQGGQPFQAITVTPTAGGGEIDFQGDTTLDGAQAVSITQQNATPPVVDSNHNTWLATSRGLVTMNPQAFTIEMWIKFVSGTIYLGAAAVPITESLVHEDAGPASFVGWYTSAGRLDFVYQDPNGGLAGPHAVSGAWDGFPDGQWHYLAVNMFGSNQFRRFIDGTTGTTFTYPFTPSQALGINTFFLEVTTAFGDPVSTASIANLAAYPYALTPAQGAAHYNRGAGFIGEVTGARVTRLLGQYWAGPATVAPGFRKLAPDNASGGNDYNTRFVLDVLQEIQETERGLLYADASGVVVFEDSTSRNTGNLSSLWVFGENPAGASPPEFPYVELVEDFDPTYTFSQTNLTRPNNTSFAPLPNPLPTNPRYGQRVLTQEVQVNSDFDLFEFSRFYLHRYGSPVIRVDTLTLDPAANPALWPVVLSLEISQRITVVRRTSAGLTTRSDYYIEQITHDIDIEQGGWKVSLQCSPVFNPVAWILGDATDGVLGSTTVPIF